MKLNESRPHIETSEDLEEQFFSIQDQGMIFDILRNKMYSNPILAICREISCNARDAHREVGTPEVPVQITLPTPLDAFLKIKDFGPGISPDRMSNIFIKYTASTKRNDNLQTGGFGLGAKTPFSYSDTFTIKTIFNGIEYNYACFIDETKVGKLALMDQKSTSEPNGTEIIIPVKPADFRAFSENIERACRHWEVLPTIKNGNLDFKKVTPIIEGTNWKMVASTDYYKSVKLIIDGIEYPVDISAIKSLLNVKALDYARGDILLYFGVGELSLSASREQVYLDKPTQKIISERFQALNLEIKKIVEDRINSFKNLWDANVYYKSQLSEAFRSLDFLGSLSWKGYKLDVNHSSHLGCVVFSFKKGGHIRGKGYDPNKIKRSLCNSIYYNEHSVLAINDTHLREPTQKHVEKAFKDNPKLKEIQLICPNDQVTIKSLNKDFNLDQMCSLNLSDLTDAKGRKDGSVQNTKSYARLLIYKYCIINDIESYRQISHAEMAADKNIKVFCRLDTTSPKTPFYKNILFSHDAMNIIQKNHKNYSFYGVVNAEDLDKVKEKDPSILFLDDIVDQALNDKDTFIKYKYALEEMRTYDYRLLQIPETYLTKIKDPNSILTEYLTKYRALQKESEGKSSWVYFYEKIKGNITKKDIGAWKTKSSIDLNALLDKINKTYPMLQAISSYEIRNIAKEIIDYINLIDRVNKMDEGEK